MQSAIATASRRIQVVRHAEKAIQNASLMYSNIVVHTIAPIKMSQTAGRTFNVRI